ncbi:MAG TPA: glutathione S-transferase family protein [Candidatus Binataceae bacterium]
MKLRLYQFHLSPFCAKVRKILDYKGLPCELVEVDYIERKELVAASGQAMVPALTFADGTTVNDSEKIVERLEMLQPEPTLFPSGWHGVHRALARYFDTEFEELMLRAAMPDLLEARRRDGAEALAMFRLIKERKYGEGFCERMCAQSEANTRRAAEAMAPLDESLTDRAFLTGRIGLADFALYGQLYLLAFGGELKIPFEFRNLRAFFSRIDRIEFRLDQAG